MVHTVGVRLDSRHAKLNQKLLLTYLGALAPIRALVVSGERALENERQRCHCHPHWLPTEGGICDFEFLGTILAVLQFPGSCGGREFSLTWWVVVEPVGHRTNGKLPNCNFINCSIWPPNAPGPRTNVRVIGGIRSHTVSSNSIIIGPIICNVSVCNCQAVFSVHEPGESLKVRFPMKSNSWDIYSSETNQEREISF